ncbi:MAG TPA: class I adenylate-forming enzyme family protein [Conexibacter sp.]|nr:class I adenylate-forming enzyme family protein [Conexibacter sp.]
MNLATDLERRAAEVPDRIGLHFEDGRAWSYAQIDAEASACARALAAAGVQRGERVALYLANTPELAFAIYGAWKLGAVPVTISGLYNGAELSESITKTAPVLLVADEHDRDARDAALAAATDLKLLTQAQLGAAANARAPFPAGTVNAEDEAVILFTGGTTGRPKAVSVTHGGVQESLARLARASKGRAGPYAAAPDGTPPNLVALPLFHSGGQHTLLFAFHVGRTAVLWERFRVATLERLLEQHQFDSLFLLPTMLYDVVHADDTPDLASVRSVLVAGQALSIHLRRQFEERFGIPIVMNYGSTETGHIAGWTAQDMKAGLWKAGSAGRLYAGVELEVRDDDGAALQRGETGEIVVRSAMTKGYVDDDAASGELVRDGWVHSGDMGYVDEDGVLFLVGRKRDMIKCGGFQVWPEEIEEELRAHPLVRDVRVVGIADERLGEIPQAIVVREEGKGERASDDEVAATLLAYVRQRLSHFKAPRSWAFMDELPRSEAGKVRRDALAAAGARAVEA